MPRRISALGTQSWACLRGELHLDALGGLLEWPGSQMTTCTGCPGAVWLLLGPASSSVWREDPGLLSSHAGKEGPQLARTGASHRGKA